MSQFYRIIASHRIVAYVLQAKIFCHILDKRIETL